MVTERVLRGKRRSSLKVKVKRGRKHPMRRSDPLSQEGRNTAQRSRKVHGKDKGRRGQGEEKGGARREDVPKLRKYEKRRTRQVVEKLEGVDEAVGLSKSVAPVEVGYLGQNHAWRRDAGMVAMWSAINQSLGFSRAVGSVSDTSNGKVFYQPINCISTRGKNSF